MTELNDYRSQTEQHNKGVTGRVLVANGIQAFRRIKRTITDGVANWTYAGADEVGFGQSRRKVLPVSENGQGQLSARQFDTDETYLVECTSPAISDGDIVYAAANGMGQALPTAAGTYTKLGEALRSKAVGDGLLVEIAPSIDHTGKTTTVTE